MVDILEEDDAFIRAVGALGYQPIHRLVICLQAECRVCRMIAIHAVCLASVRNDADVSSQSNPPLKS